YHRMLGAAFFKAGAGKKQYGASYEAGLILHRCNKGFYIEVGICAVPGIKEPVKDQQSRPMATRLVAQKFDHGRQPFVAEGLENADVDDFLTQLAAVEELERGQRLKQALVPFRKQRHIEHTFAGGSMSKRNLIGQNGFTRARPSLNDIRGAFNEPAMKDAVKPLDPA